MQDRDTVQAFLTALEAKDIQTVASYLSDTFILHGNLSKHPGKYVFLGLLIGLAFGIPDFSFNPQEVQAVGDTIEATVQFTGTHTGLLNLSLALPGLPTLPPTGKRLSRSAYCIKFTVCHGQIVRADLNHREDSIFLWII